MVPEKWVLGIYDTRAKRGFITYVPNRSAPVLIAVIQAHVLPGSIIWSDCWRGYRDLGQLGGVSPYEHHTVNHSRFFKDPDTGVCTNYVEGYWSTLKQYLRRLGVMSQSHFLAEYIDQFLWSQMFGETAVDRFRNLILHIGERYRFRQ